jgi:hypothetical protein
MVHLFLYRGAQYKLSQDIDCYRECVLQLLPFFLQHLCPRHTTPKSPRADEPHTNPEVARPAANKYGNRVFPGLEAASAKNTTEPTPHEAAQPSFTMPFTRAAGRSIIIFSIFISTEKWHY